jgi:hypothetical protein
MAGYGMTYGQLRGPGPGGIPPLTLDGFDPQTGSYRDKNGGITVFKDAFGARIYDTWRIKAGTALPTNQFRFFQTALGGQTAGLNFTTQFQKTEIDTNLEQPGAIQKGRLFRVISMQIRLIETGATDTTYGSSGVGTEMPTAPTGAAVVSATNEIKALLEGSFYFFQIDDRRFEVGKGVHFPSPYGFSGFAGSGAPGGSGAGTDAEAVVNNGSTYRPQPLAIAA